MRDIQYRRLDATERQSSQYKGLLFATIGTVILIFLFYNISPDISKDARAQRISRLLWNLNQSINDSVKPSNPKSTMEKQMNKFSAIPLFKKRPEAAHIDCGRALTGDIKYMRTLQRVRLKPNLNLTMDCKSIKRRITLPKRTRPLNYSVAHVRIVFKDYEFLEAELRSSYHRENYFCYSIDKKATKEFHAKIQALAKCLPNVMTPSKEFDVDSYGHNMHYAHFSCLEMLNAIPKWNYAILLQNHDVIIKTPYELAKIYQELGGVNDVEITPCPSDRYNHSYQYDATSLYLFRNPAFASPAQLKAKVNFAKGAVQASLTREAVRWLVDTVDLTTIITAINSMEFGVDEVLIPTLQVSDDLEMPGRFTYRCFNQGGTFISRMSHWEYYDQRRCATNYLRKGICILGLEDLPSMELYPHIMVNKYLPDFDYGGVECLHELLYNRTFFDQPTKFDWSFYGKMPHVFYHKARMANDRNYTLRCDGPKAEELVKYPYYSNNLFGLRIGG